MIRKIENISSVKLCVRQSQRVPTEQENYNPIQNSYAALWDEYKELKTANTVKNVMLAEYWFDDTDKLQRWENILHGVFQ